MAKDHAPVLAAGGEAALQLEAVSRWEAHQARVAREPEGHAVSAPGEGALVLAHWRAVTVGGLTSGLPRLAERPAGYDFGAGGGGPGGGGTAAGGGGAGGGAGLGVAAQYGGRHTHAAPFQTHCPGTRTAPGGGGAGMAYGGGAGTT